MGLAYKITDKDWMRMQNLIRQEGAVPYAGKSIADKINKKDKALARFTAGIKLAGFPIENFMDMEYSQMPRELPFYEFWRKARMLGATEEEVEELYTKYDIPEQFLDGNTEYYPVSSRTATVLDKNGYRTVDIPDERDLYILSIAQKFDRYRIPVKFKRVNKTLGACREAIHNRCYRSDYSGYEAARQLENKIVKNFSFYEITLFPNDEYSKLVLTMVGYNGGHSWLLCDFNPANLGCDIGFSKGMDLNETMNCIKNYLGI